MAAWKEITWEGLSGLLSGCLDMLRIPTADRVSEQGIQWIFRDQ